MLDSPDPAQWEELVAAEPGRKKVAELAGRALSKLCYLGDARGMRAEVARKVIERMREVTGEQALAVLRRGLGHLDPNVRSEARQALDERGQPPADDDERRLRAMDDEDWKTLKKLGPGVVTELLISQLRSADRWGRAEAAEKLGKLGDQGAAGPLAEALGDEDDTVRGRAATALAELADPAAVPALLARLAHGDEWARCRISDALGKLGDARAVGPLAEALGDLHKTVRRAAARALGRLGGPDVVPALARALRDPDVETRQIAAEGLAGTGDGPSSRVLAGALTDEDDRVRALAARALAGRQGADVEAALVAALASPGRGARRAAAEALAACGWRPADDRQRALTLVAMENPLGAEALGEAAVDALGIAVADGGHYYLCQTAAECLGRLFDPRAVGALCTALRESTDMTVRAAAATALGHIRDHTATEAVSQALKDEPDAWARPYLAEALARLQAAAEGDRLALALEGPEPNVQRRAAVLLARHGDPRGWAWLEQAAGGDDSLVRGKAITALRELGGPAAIQALIDRVSAGGFDGPNEAVDALVALGQAAARPMAQALVGMAHNARWVTLTGLARLGAPGLAELQAVLSGADRELKQLTCEVLGRVGDREDVPHKPIVPLRALADDPDEEVRRSAEHALRLLKAD
jgi:HEAT repeat protein